jgi:hypothetical protein
MLELEPYQQTSEFELSGEPCFMTRTVIAECVSYYHAFLLLSESSSSLVSMACFGSVMELRRRASRSTVADASLDNCHLREASPESH